jgi:hypothetical protein
VGALSASGGDSVWTAAGIVAAIFIDMPKKLLSQAH